LSRQIRGSDGSAIKRALDKTAEIGRMPNGLRKSKGKVAELVSATSGEVPVFSELSVITLSDSDPPQ